MYVLPGENFWIQAHYLTWLLSQSWQVADDMLHQKVDIESCYIAAQTMRNKIQNSFHELPKESHHSLKVSLKQNLLLNYLHLNRKKNAN